VTCIVFYPQGQSEHLPRETEIRRQLNRIKTGHLFRRERERKRKREEKRNRKRKRKKKEIEKRREVW
jgi:hypothetical protein